MAKQTHVFQAEVRQLLDLVVHSLYSKKEIFLRELISNASDAIDRAQYEGLTDPTLVADAPAWRIDLIADKQARTLTIVDNGSGLTAAEAESHLGTIARSGTKAFLEAIQARQSGGGDAPEMIGQFGVGFYSAFMVAERVVVDSLRRGAGQTAMCWSSDGQGEYTLEPSTRTEPGTAVVLHLREGMDHYLEEREVKALVKRYSDFIVHPVRFAAEGRPPAADAAPLNTMRALWRRNKSEIRDDEYAEFYKHLTHDFHAPLRTIHLALEGQLEFRALLFIPAQAPFDLFLPNRKHGLHLYVRNVFIGSDFEALLPEYLRFVAGVVDSSDLPLNVSRELLQDDAVIRKIRANLIGKILGALETLKREKPEEYAGFYRAFGRILKEGLHFDREHAERLKDLVLFHSDRTAEQGLIALRQYRDAMPSTQTEIYFLAAESLETARQSPLLEAFRQRNLDVLFLVDPVDEWVTPALDVYDGCKLRAIDRGDLELGDETQRAEERRQREEAEPAFRPLLDFLRAKLTDEVSDVRLSGRLTESACCLVSDGQGPGANLERILRAMGQEAPKQRRILEVNPRHALLTRLKGLFETDRDSAQLAEFVGLLFDQALVAEGAAPRNPRQFTQALARLMAGNG